MSEEHGPKELVLIARTAEERGFEFLVQSDHYHPWVPEQQHSPYAWSVLGAVAATTERIRLATFVTCPTYRYHPAVIAQKAATMALLSDNRFTLSVGSGERLNEHIIGGGWPSVTVRHERLVEAVQIIRQLWEGGYQSFEGKHFTVSDARVFDLPDEPIPLAVAVSGDKSLELAVEHADELIAIEPKGELVAGFRAVHADAHATCQIAVCFDPDRSKALETAHKTFRWSTLGWKVNAELPNPVNFDAATQMVTPEQVGEAMPCGPDAQVYIDAVRSFADAGFDRVAFVQVGENQDGFFDFWSDELSGALAEEFGNRAAAS